MNRTVQYTASKGGVRKKKLNPAVRYAIRSLSSGMKLSNTDGCDRYASLQRISSHWTLWTAPFSNSIRSLDSASSAVGRLGSACPLLSIWVLHSVPFVAFLASLP